MSRMLGRAREATCLVVVPSAWLGVQAEKAGLIGKDEAWVPAGRLEEARGHRFEAWRYLDTLDAPPPPGSRVDVVEAWLAREDTPFPPLPPSDVIALDAMVMLAAP